MSKAPARKKAAKPPKPKSVYYVVREVPSEATASTEPDRVFASKQAAEAHAEKLNRELRRLLNPFGDTHDLADVMPGGQRALAALLKTLGLKAPKRQPDESHIDWEEWWDAHYFDLTEAQRDAVWDALTKFDWYEVRETTLEG